MDGQLDYGEDYEWGYGEGYLAALRDIRELAYELSSHNSQGNETVFTIELLGRLEKLAP